MSEKSEEPRAAAEDADKAIDRLRENIDEVDGVLVKLFNQRAQWALEIGEVKKAAGIAIYQPGREKVVLDAVQQRNRGPLGHGAVQRLFERIIDESRRLERIGPGDEGSEQ
jgi:chorismate mutase